MSDYKYREYKYFCGDFLDVDIYPVFKKQGSRNKKFKETTEVQKKLNENNAAKKLERLLHTNFTSQDYALHLTYLDKFLPENETGAKKDIQNFLRRAKRFYKKKGIELKYVCITEKGKQSERLHHHLVLSGGVDRTELEDLWRKGYANTRRLKFTKNGIAGLSNYMIKQPLFFKRWSCSKNLKHPEERKNDSKYNRTKARAIFEFQYEDEKIEKLYPGYYLSEVEPVYNEVNGGYYIRMRLYKKEARLL